MSKRINVLPMEWERVKYHTSIAGLTVEKFKEHVFSALFNSKDYDMTTGLFRNESEWNFMHNTMKDSIEDCLLNLIKTPPPNPGGVSLSLSYTLNNGEKGVLRINKAILLQNIEKIIYRKSDFLIKEVPNIDLGPTIEKLTDKIQEVEVTNKHLVAMIEENNKSFETKINTLAFLVESLWNANLAMKDTLHDYNIPFLSTLGEDIPSSEGDLSIITVMGDGNQSSGSAIYGEEI